MAENGAPSLSSSLTSSFSYTEFKPVSTSRKRHSRGHFNPTTTSHVISLGEKLAEGEWFTECSSPYSSEFDDDPPFFVSVWAFLVRLRHFYPPELLKDAWGRFSASVTSVASEGSSIRVRVLCLGLGSPSTSKDARIQLAFLVEICKCLGIVCINLFRSPRDEVMWTIFKSISLNRHRMQYRSTTPYLHEMT